MGAAECKGCSTSDPTSDTVKVNSTLLADIGGKAVAPALKQQAVELAEEQQAQEAAAEEERRQHEAEEEPRKREAEAEELQRREREQAEERERIAREEQQRVEREAQERAAAEEAAERARQEEEEEQAHRTEEALRAEQAAIAAELEEAKNKAASFLKARGFTKGVASAKQSCMKFSYPLHVAVEENSAEMVTALLKSGADKAAKNSSGLTPLALAQKLDMKRKGSYSAVVAALQ